jgi:LacI family transcriptional regulator
MVSKKTYKRATIREVATTAGVSIGTVSRVLNGKSVSVRVLEAVNSAIKDLHYTPNAIAQSMRTNSTRAVSLVVNDISNPLFSGIAKGLDKVLSANNYSLLIANTDTDPQRERVIIESLKQRRVDGLAIAVSDEDNDNIKSILQSVEFPIVLLDRELDIGADIVCDDHANGMKKALRYLFDLGHEDIALITGDDSVRPSRERATGYRDAFRELKKPANEYWIRQGQMTSRFGYEEAVRLLEGDKRPTAIIAGGNLILSGVLRAIRQFDLSIPEDLSLISCDEVDLAVLMNPPITVITRDISLIGQLAAEQLLRRIDGSADPAMSRQSIPTELVVRESCTRLL